MISDEELLELGQEGYLVGPNETEENFLQRVEKAKTICASSDVKKPYLSWIKTQLFNLYGFAPQKLPAFFSDKELKFFQGAVTSINDGVPTIYLKKRLKKGRYLFIYELEEILAHEAVHFARSSFQEPKFEEIFAYLTSSSRLRKVLGPIIRTEREAIIFLLLLILTLVFELISSTLFLTFLAATLTYISVGFFRLFRLRRIFSKASKKVSSVYKKPLSILLMLKDEEIFLFSGMERAQILEHTKKDPSLRWRQIRAFLQHS